MSWFLLMSLLTSNIQSATIECGDETICSCNNLVPNESCNFLCTYETAACMYSTLHCSKGHPCSIACDGERSCEGIVFDAKTATDISIICGALNSNGCTNAQFDCGTGSCSMDCQGSCDSTFIIIQPETKQFSCSSGCPTIMMDAVFSSVSTSTPTNNPMPMLYPTNNPSSAPDPTQTPTKILTNNPTLSQPTNDPTTSPTKQPTLTPTNNPTQTTLNPTKPPTNKPTLLPTIQPTILPSNIPTIIPTNYPTISPIIPTKKPTSIPTISPTFKPIATMSPTTNYPSSPTYNLTLFTTHSQPTNHPDPSINPTYIPTNIPTLYQSPTYTHNPTLFTSSPTNYHTTDNPTRVPTIYPSLTSPTITRNETKVTTLVIHPTVIILISIITFLIVACILCLVVISYFAKNNTRQKYEKSINGDRKSRNYHESISIIEESNDDNNIHVVPLNTGKCEYQSTNINLNHVNVEIDSRDSDVTVIKKSKTDLLQQQVNKMVKLNYGANNITHSMLSTLQKAVNEAKSHSDFRTVEDIINKMELTIANGNHQVKTECACAQNSVELLSLLPYIMTSSTTSTITIPDIPSNVSMAKQNTVKTIVPSVSTDDVTDIPKIFPSAPKNFTLM